MVEGTATSQGSRALEEKLHRVCHRRALLSTLVDCKRNDEMERVPTCAQLYGLSAETAKSRCCVCRGEEFGVKEVVLEEDEVDMASVLQKVPPPRARGESDGQSGVARLGKPSPSALLASQLKADDDGEGDGEAEAAEKSKDPTPWHAKVVK